MPLCQLQKYTEVIGIGKYLAACRVTVNIFGCAGCQCPVYVDAKQTRFFPARLVIRSTIPVEIPNNGNRTNLHQCQVLATMHTESVGTCILARFQHSSALRIHRIVEPVGTRVSCDRPANNLLLTGAI